jgi:two-component system response regulator MprA
VQALTAARSGQFDLIVLDVMMPYRDGLDVCRALRTEANRVPILMVTARTETADRVAGLDAGADDYVPKPYDIDELLARVRALLRRADTNLATATAADEAPLREGPVTLDPAARRVWSGEREVALSRAEFDLLES